MGAPFLRRCADPRYRVVIFHSFVPVLRRIRGRGRARFDARPPRGANPKAADTGKPACRSRYRRAPNSRSARGSCQTAGALGVAAALRRHGEVNSPLRVRAVRTGRASKARWIHPCKICDATEYIARVNGRRRIHGIWVTMRCTSAITRARVATKRGSIHICL